MDRLHRFAVFIYNRYIVIIIIIIINFNAFVKRSQNMVSKEINKNPISGESMRN